MIRHSYAHPEPGITTYGLFGPFCYSCFVLACIEDVEAGIHSSVTG